MASQAQDGCLEALDMENEQQGRIPAARPSVHLEHTLRTAMGHCGLTVPNLDLHLLIFFLILAALI